MGASNRLITTTLSIWNHTNEVVVDGEIASPAKTMIATAVGLSIDGQPCCDLFIVAIMAARDIVASKIVT